MECSWAKMSTGAHTGYYLKVNLTMLWQELQFLMNGQLFNQCSTDALHRPRHLTPVKTHIEHLWEMVPRHTDIASSKESCTPRHLLISSKCTQLLSDQNDTPDDVTTKIMLCYFFQVMNNSKLFILMMLTILSKY